MPTERDGDVKTTPEEDAAGSPKTIETTRPSVATVRSFVVTVLDGGANAVSCSSASTRLSIGSHSLNNLVLDDPTVSRFHCELRIDGADVVAADLGSRNGTLVDGVTVREALLRDGSTLRLGNSSIRFNFGDQPVQVALSTGSRFGAVVGASVAMRSAFALLERAAATDATVLLEGETGTGKGAVVEAIHAQSARARGPFVVLDCSSIAPNLLESELFGHEKGAFTGATTRHVGAFEAASGGTLFLDEIGELPLDLQPKLLRALENRIIRRVGSTAAIPVDIRVISATNRNLRAEVNSGQFRSDLYFRLAVVKIALPPLRHRPDDIPPLVEHILAALKAPPEQRDRILRPESIAAMQRAAWPGNVRELRNHIERLLIFDDESFFEGESTLPVAPAPRTDLTVPTDLPYSEARQRILAEFDRQYCTLLLAKHGGQVSRAAAAAGVHRVHFYKILRKTLATR